MKDEVEELILNFFFVEGGQIVIYDANNGSAKHRRNTLKKFEDRGVHVIFLGQSLSSPDAQKSNEIRMGSRLIIRITVRQGRYH